MGLVIQASVEEVGEGGGHLLSAVKSVVQRNSLRKAEHLEDRVKCVLKGKRGTDLVLHIHKA